MRRYQNFFALLLTNMFLDAHYNQDKHPRRRMAGMTTWELDDQAFAGARAPHNPTMIEWQGRKISVFFFFSSFHYY
jgi:hypothetical protein